MNLKSLFDSWSSILIFALCLITLLLIVLYLVTRKRQGGSNTQDSTNNQVYVGNLSYRVKERDLRQLFESIGEIEHLKIIKNHNTGRSKGFGFVTFVSTSDAQDSLRLNGEDFEGRFLVVRIAKPK